MTLTGSDPDVCPSRQVVAKLQHAIHLMGRSSAVFMVGKLNVAKLANFDQGQPTPLIPRPQAPAAPTFTNISAAMLLAKPPGPVWPPCSGVPGVSRILRDILGDRTLRKFVLDTFSWYPLLIFAVIPDSQVWSVQQGFSGLRVGTVSFLGF